MANIAKESDGLGSPITNNVKLPSYNILLNVHNMILDQKICVLEETSEKNCCLISLNGTLESINNKCRNETSGSLSLGSFFTNK